MSPARFSTFPLFPRMSVASRSRWMTCRSNNTTDTLDHVSRWLGGRPRGFVVRVRSFTFLRFAIFLSAGRDYNGRFLLAQTQPLAIVVHSLN
jgi:hypothetical protein